MVFFSCTASSPHKTPPTLQFHPPRPFWGWQVRFLCHAAARACTNVAKYLSQKSGKCEIIKHLPLLPSESCAASFSGRTIFFFAEGPDDRRGFTFSRPGPWLEVSFPPVGDSEGTFFGGSNF